MNLLHTQKKQKQQKTTTTTQWAPQRWEPPGDGLKIHICHAVFRSGYQQHNKGHLWVQLASSSWSTWSCSSNTTLCQSKQLQHSRQITDEEKKKRRSLKRPSSFYQIIMVHFTESKKKKEKKKEFDQRGLWLVEKEHVMAVPGTEQNRVHDLLHRSDCKTRLD